MKRIPTDQDGEDSVKNLPQPIGIFRIRTLNDFGHVSKTTYVATFGKAVRLFRWLTERDYRVVIEACDLQPLPQSHPGNVTLRQYGVTTGRDMA